MNDDHLYPLESAARFYCRHRGLNPDQLIDVKDTSALVIVARPKVSKVPVWKMIAEELIDLHIRLQALQIAQHDARDAQRAVAIAKDTH